MGCSSSKKISSLKQLRNGHLHDGRSRQEIPFLRQLEILGSSPTSLDLSSDESMLVIGKEDSTIEIWSTMSNPSECLAILKGHKSKITCVQFYGNDLISGCSDGELIQWSLMSMAPVKSFHGHSSKINQVACVGQFLFSSSYDRTCRGWTLQITPDENNNDMSDFGNSGISSNQSMSQNPRQSGGSIPMSLQGTDDGDGDEWTDKPIDPSCLYVLRGHSKAVYPIAFIPAEDDDYWNQHRDAGRFHERDLIVSGSADSTAIIWSATSGEMVKILEGHSAGIYSIVVDVESGNNTIFTAGGDGVILAFDPITGELIRKLIGHESAILDLVSHKTMLFSCSTDKTARAWVMEFGEETRIFRCGRSPVTCIQEMDGFVVTGSQDGSIRIFDCRSGSLLRTFSVGQEPESILGLRMIRGKVFSLSANESLSTGRLCVWNSRGLKLETVFGQKDVIEPEEEEDLEDDGNESDGSSVIRAIEILDKFLKERVY